MILQPFRYLGTDVASVDAGGVRITHTNYEAHQVQPWHCHETPNFFFLLGGDFTDESRELGAETPELFSLVYHPAGALHRSFAGPQGRSGLNIEPTRAWLSRHELTDEDLGKYRVQTDAKQSLDLIHIALAYFNHREIEDSVLEALLGEQQDDTREGPAWFRRFEKLVREDQTWTLASLAAELAVHPVYLARVFRRRTGITVTQHLHRQRMIRATQLLVRGGPLQEVAIESGFADHAHFSRAFLREFGTTPTQARQLLREGFKSSSA